MNIDVRATTKIKNKLNLINTKRNTHTHRIYCYLYKYMNVCMYEKIK